VSVRPVSHKDGLSNTTMLRKHGDQLIEGMRQDRTSWWAHWREVADFILPRRNRWLVTTNTTNRGAPLNYHIVRNTAQRAARVCASGMMAGCTSPSKPWFSLALANQPAEPNSAVAKWLDEVKKRMLRVFAESNYYTAKATQYFDLTVFGTSPMIIYEDFEDVIRCYVPTVGEFFVANDNRMDVTTLAREFTWTIAQTVKEFGIENVSANLQQAYKAGGAQLLREIKIHHVFEPNDEVEGQRMVPSIFKWREVFWEAGSPSEEVLRVKGYYEKPFSAPRWDLAGNDAYGRSPGMDALGDTKQLQLMVKRQAQGVDKLINPPLLGDVTMKNEPAAVIPGGITYAINTAQGVGLRPVYQVDPKVLEITQLIEKIEKEIKEEFFNDLFLMISQLDTVRTATEVDARREEKLIQPGPVLERFQAESLDQDIERTYAIMVRASQLHWKMGQDGVLPLPPQEIQGAHLQIAYVSMLAEAQRAASTTAIERLAQFMGNLAAVNPEVLDNVDFDEMVDEYADALGVSPKVIRATAAVMQLRDARAKQQQAAQTLQASQSAAQTGATAAQGAQTLSQTDVGGGQNALQLMLSGEGSSAPAGSQRIAA
jgi:hypothetical protein